MVEKPEPPNQRGYAESPRERRIANLIILAILLAVLGAGIWLVDALLDQRAVDECLARGGRNCARLDLPAR